MEVWVREERVVIGPDTTLEWSSSSSEHRNPLDRGAFSNKHLPSCGSLIYMGLDGVVVVAFA